LCTGLLVCDGCSNTGSGNWFFRPSLAQDLRTALENPSPDQRRKAVVRIAKRKQTPDDTVYKVLSFAARNDTNASVRCAAIRALDSKMDERAVPPLVMILLYKSHPEQAHPPEDKVRWDAILVLSHAIQRGLLPPENQEAIRRELVSIVITAGNRNVRIAAAMALADFHHREVLTALIGALREEDFGIVYAAEDSLVALTGVTHEYDADAWLKWLKSTDDPFANAGAIPEGYKTRPGSSWERTWAATKRFFAAPPPLAPGP